MKTPRGLHGGVEPDGFEVPPPNHPVLRIMLGNAVLALSMIERLLPQVIYVIDFDSPVLPRGEARIQVQLSVPQSTEDVDFAIEWSVTS